MSEGVWVVRIPGSRSFVQACDSDKVADLKARLQADLGSQDEQLCFIFEGRGLSEGETLGSCGVATARRPTIHLLSRGAAEQRAPSPPLPENFSGLRVSVIGGRGLDVEAEESETVGSVKTKLCEQLGAPASQQCLIFGGVELSDGQTLGAQGVSASSGATLHVLLRRPAREQEEGPPPPRTDGPPPFQVGGILERRIDGLWFEARVLALRAKGGGAAVADLRYLETFVVVMNADDGNVEKDVPLEECRTTTGKRR